MTDQKDKDKAPEDKNKEIESGIKEAGVAGAVIDGLKKVGDVIKSAFEKLTQQVYSINQQLKQGKQPKSESKQEHSAGPRLGGGKRSEDDDSNQ